MGSKKKGGGLQNRSVTSGKGLALRVGPRGLQVEVAAARVVCFTADCLGGPSYAWRIPRRRTTSSELERTRGIRLFN